MKKSNTLMIIALALCLAMGIMPVYAANDALAQTDAQAAYTAQLETKAGVLEKRISELKNASAANISSEERDDALKADASLKKLYDNANTATEKAETAKNNADAAAEKVDEANETIASYHTSSKTINMLLSPGETIQTQIDKNKKRIDTLKAILEALRTTPVRKAYDEQVVIREAYDEQILIEEAYDEQILVNDAYDEQVLVRDAYTEEIEADWTTTLPDGARKAEPIYVYGRTCNTCGEFFCDDDDVIKTEDQSLVGQVIDGKRYVLDGGSGTASAKWMEHSLDMAYAWEKAGKPEDSPLYGHGRWHNDRRIVGLVVYYDAQYKTVHHDAEYKTVHHDAEYETVHHDAEYENVHHDAEYDTNSIEGLKGEIAALQNQTLSLASFRRLEQDKETAEADLPALEKEAADLASAADAAMKAAEKARVAYEKALPGAVLAQTEKKLADLKDTIKKERDKVPKDLADGFYTMPGVYKKQTVRLEKTGSYYTIFRKDGLALDVSGGRKTDGTPVGWYSPNGTNAQKWLPLKNGAVLSMDTGFMLTQDKNGGFSIRRAAGANGTPSETQTFILTPAKVDIASVKMSSSGLYIIANAGEASMPKLTAYGTTLRQDIDFTAEKEVSERSVRYVFTGIGSFTGTANSSARLAYNSGFESGVYYRISAKTDRHTVLSVKGGGLGRSTNVQLEHFSGQLQDYWLFEAQPDGTYVIRNARSGLVLDVWGGRTQNHTNVQQYTANGSPAQKFIINQRSAGAYEIIGLGSRKALDMNGAKTTPGTNVQIYTPNKSGAQRWFIEAVGRRPEVSGTHKIISHVGKATKAVSVQGTSRDDRANIFLWDAAQSASAKWTFSVNNDDARTWNIRSAYSGKALDVKRAGSANGTNVQQYSFANGNIAQKWVLMEDLNDASITIFSVCSGKAMDVSGGMDKNRANIQIYAPNSSNAQKWSLEKIA